MKNFNEKWIEILTNNDKEKEREFAEVLSNSKSEVLAIMKFRRLEKDKGRGQEVTVDKLLQANDTEIAGLLEKLFLEPILPNHIRKVDIRKLHKKHTENSRLRYLSIALTL